MTNQLQEKLTKHFIYGLLTVEQYKAGIEKLHKARANGIVDKLLYQTPIHYDKMGVKL